MALGRDVVLLDLLANLERLAAPDREDLVDLAGVIREVAGGHRDDVAHRRRVARVQRPHAREVERLVDVAKPYGASGIEPREHLADVLVARVDRVAEATRPVDLFPGAWRPLERIRVIDVRPADGVLGQPEDRPVPAARVQELVERQAPNVVVEHGERLAEHGARQQMPLAHRPHRVTSAATGTGGAIRWRPWHRMRPGRTTTPRTRDARRAISCSTS